MLISSYLCGVKQDTKRHIASWVLLAIYLPMLVFSSVHVHEDSYTANEIECTDCVHHSCHGHLMQDAVWTHDCVLCQFLSLTMLTATLVAVTVYIQVCSNNNVWYASGNYAACSGIIVTRGPPLF